MKKHRGLAKATIVFNAILLFIAAFALTALFTPPLTGTSGSSGLMILFLCTMMSVSSILAIALAAKYLEEE